MERLWSPWRSQYISAFGTDAEYRGCVFCDARAADRDDDLFLVRRHGRCFTMLNLYPYNSGHLLVVPNAHVDTLAALDPETYGELTEVARRWLPVLDDAMHPQGYNIGSNIGRAAGAGIAAHVHLHVVPRWHGDANFMPVIGDTKVISHDMRETMLQLRAGFDRAAGA
jgi:ATP adenylyltransferase